MPQIGGKPKVSKATKVQKKKSSSLTSKRHFTVVIGSKEHGLYVSSSPSSAARKAVSKLCATDKKRKVSFHIREITQKSEKKNYGPYLGYIEKLAKPIELKGRVIKYKPVAKLVKKTGKNSAVKKGGMQGGANGLLVKCETRDAYFRAIESIKNEQNRNLIKIVNINNNNDNNDKIVRKYDFKIKLALSVLNHSDLVLNNRDLLNRILVSLNSIQDVSAREMKEEFINNVSQKYM